MSYPTPTILTRKLDTLYGAYAPEFDVCSYGTCSDEAVNNLADELKGKRITRSIDARAGDPPSHEATAGEEGTGYEKEQA